MSKSISENFEKHKEGKLLVKKPTETKSKAWKQVKPGHFILPF